MRILLSCLTLAMVFAMPTTAKAVTPEDTAMAHRIAANLKQSGQLQDYKVGVKYEGGIAWLNGSVTSATQAQSAINIAKATPGVQRVVSQLLIPTAPQQSQIRRTSAQQGIQQIPAQAPQRGIPGVPYGVRRTSMGEGVQPMGFQRAAQMRAAMQAPAGHMPGPGAQRASYDTANMPNYAWPSYAAHPNYAALTYPKQYSPSAWPYIGPFYPYPQVPLGWRKVTLEWDDGWWMLDFNE